MRWGCDGVIGVIRVATHRSLMLLCAIDMYCMTVHVHVCFEGSRHLLAWTEEGVAGPGRRVAACCLGACRDNESGLFARKVFRRPTCAQKRPQAAVAFSG